VPAVVLPGVYDGANASSDEVHSADSSHEAVSDPELVAAVGSSSAPGSSSAADATDVGGVDAVAASNVVSSLLSELLSASYHNIVFTAILVEAIGFLGSIAIPEPKFEAKGPTVFWDETLLGLW
jgi:hypothetical protein